VDADAAATDAAEEDAAEEEVVAEAVDAAEAVDEVGAGAAQSQLPKPINPPSQRAHRCRSYLDPGPVFYCPARCGLAQFRARM
jgi:hypothetical protein